MYINSVVFLRSFNSIRYTVYILKVLALLCQGINKSVESVTEIFEVGRQEEYSPVGARYCI